MEVPFFNSSGALASVHSGAPHLGISPLLSSCLFFFFCIFFFPSTRPLGEKWKADDWFRRESRSDPADTECCEWKGLNHGVDEGSGVETTRWWTNHRRSWVLPRNTTAVKHWHFNVNVSRLNVNIRQELLKSLYRVHAVHRHQG